MKNSFRKLQPFLIWWPDAVVVIGTLLLVVYHRSPSSTPVFKAKTVDAVSAHTVIITPDGELLGCKYDYMFDDTPPLSRAIPARAADGQDWQSVTTGWQTVAGIKQDGSLWIWGTGPKLWGDDTLNVPAKPVRFTTATDWKTVASGNNFFIGLKTNGTLWAWGGNRHGQLGIGEHGGKGRPEPVQIGSGTNWASVSARIFRATALKTDGTLWAWGWNVYGELGDGTYQIRDAPVQIGTANDWVSVHTPNDHTFAIKKDGSLWVWGDNREGQFGNGTKIKTPSPQRVGTDNDWLMAAGGRDHTIALKKDGSLWAWGLNTQGELGDGTLTSRLTPVRIGRSRDWTFVAAGEHHSLAVKSNGSLYAWGSLLAPREGKWQTFWRQTPWIAQLLSKIGIRQSPPNIFVAPRPVYAPETAPIQK